MPFFLGTHTQHLFDLHCHPEHLWLDRGSKSFEVHRSNRTAQKSRTPVSDETPAQRFDIATRPNPAARDEFRTDQFEPFLGPRGPAVIFWSSLGTVDDGLYDAVSRAFPEPGDAASLRREKDRTARRCDLGECRLAETREDE